MNRIVDITLNHPRLIVHTDAIKKAIHRLDGYHRHKVDEGALSIAYVTNRIIAEIHSDFMDDPTPTDVITFPDDPPEDAGEICISVDYALRAALRFRTDPAYELTLYLIHGWLHLAGFDDRTLTDKRKMRMAEKELMGFLVRHNAIIPFTIKGHSTETFTSDGYSPATPAAYSI